MPMFRYDGPDPVPGDDGEIVRPGQVAEMDAPPDWGPWSEVAGEDGGGPERPRDAPPPAAPAPPPARPAKPATPPAAGKEGE